MQVRLVEEKREWDEFFNQNGSPSFLHAWEWAEFNQKQGYETLQLGIVNGRKLTAIALVVRVDSRRGNFFFIPHGPVFSIPYSVSSIQECMKVLLDYLIELAKKEKCWFIRIAPVLEATDENLKLFRRLGFKKAALYMHSERMWELPLNKNEDQLLAEMRKTTRYLIKRAPRDGVVVEKRSDEKAVDDFWKIYKETFKRESFTPFSKKYIEHEFKVFNKTGNALFLFASSPRHPYSSPYLATALVLFTKSTAFYHQGASIHTKIPAAYALQWETIKEAKKRGCEKYSFWGITIPGRTPDWSGTTLFKQGFGGHQVDYIPTQDYIISRKYALTYLIEKLIAIKRG